MRTLEFEKSDQNISPMKFLPTHSVQLWSVKIKDTSDVDDSSIWDTDSNLFSDSDSTVASACKIGVYLYCFMVSRTYVLKKALCKCTAIRRR